VFADAKVASTDHLKTTWELNKAAEKGRTSAVEGVPLSLPALALAAKLLERTGRAGVAVRQHPRVEQPAEVDAQTVGDLLLAVAVLAHDHGVDPEQALRDAVRRFASDVRAVEGGHQ